MVIISIQCPEEYHIKCLRNIKVVIIIIITFITFLLMIQSSWNLKCYINRSNPSKNNTCLSLRPSCREIAANSLRWWSASYKFWNLNASICKQNYRDLIFIFFSLNLVFYMKVALLFYVFSDMYVYMYFRGIKSTTRRKNRFN